MPEPKLEVVDITTQKPALTTPLFDDNIKTQKNIIFKLFLVLKYVGVIIQEQE